ncbi:hypothetical protein niasHT_018601 [Heterodera trifolii]|uniref:Uncharacterized protein n=1 Tax=Heterodera trifolii TaxID=157864 RepID=A0ABD2LBJ4_9BILA
MGNILSLEFAFHHNPAPQQSQSNPIPLLAILIPIFLIFAAVISFVCVRFYNSFLVRFGLRSNSAHVNRQISPSPPQPTELPTTTHPLPSHPSPPPEIADIELNPRTPDTIYSSCPSNTRPTSPTNISTEFVVTIPSDEVSSTRERVRGPSPPTKDERPIHHKIQVVTGVTGPQNSNFIHLPFHSPTIARRAARPRVISRARVGSHGQLQHFPMSTQRTGWKKIARQMEGSPVPLNSIRFDSPPKSSAARSVAICETYPMAPLSHSQVIPQPNISQFPSIVLLPQSPAISLAGYSHALPRFQ